MDSPLTPRSIPDIAAPAVEHEPRDDGSFILRAKDPLREHSPVIGHWLRDWADQRPDHTFLAEREDEGWRTLSYAEAWAKARAVGQALVDRGLSVDRPLAILSGNSINHAVMALGAMTVGVPVVPVSVAYSTMSRSFDLLNHVLRLVTPKMVFVERYAPFEAALSAVDRDGIEVVVGTDATDDRMTPLSALLETPAGPSGDAAAAAVTGATVAKILMTSGSTDKPKGVINTHGMLTANQQSLLQVWPFVADSPPVLMDWLPWSHTFGGNHNLNLVLKSGGTMYIDGGRPAPGLFDATVRNLSEIAPTIQFNVPAGYAMLADALERDEALSQNFFSRLQVIFYAAAALPQDSWTRLDKLAVRTLGRRIWMTTAWGATETSPLATAANFAADRAGNIGLPVPGVELKFVPAGDKLELRVRGPNVTPGYHRDADKTAAAFDPEGFYCIGDAGQLVDPDYPASGILFDGRVSEDFKLTTGTWVNVGQVRTEVVSAAEGLLRHAVVVGHDRDWVGLLAWLDSDAAKRIANPDRRPEELVKDAKVHAVLLKKLTKYNEHVRGSSRRVARVMLCAEPPSLDAGEITDKGYVNASAVHRYREEQIEQLYDEGAASNVIVLC